MDFDLKDLDLGVFDEAEVRKYNQRVERIRKLNALADRKSGTSPEERKQAKEMAKRLMKVYGIDPGAIVMLLAVFIVFF